MGDEGDTFMRITNKDIFDEIKILSEHVKTTNGKVKLNAAMNKVNFTLIMAVIAVVLGVKFL